MSVVDRTRAKRVCLGAAAALLAATGAVATSIVPPENLGELAMTSGAVILGEAGSPRVARRGSLLFTLTTFRVLEAISGTLAKGSRVTVEVPGGELDGSGWLVPGSPHFEPGEAYLLFLDERPTGEWLTRALAYGLLRRIQGRDGSVLLAPLPETADIQPFPRADGVVPETVETYVERALVAHLRDVARGAAAWDSRKVLAGGNQVPLRAAAETAPAGCAFMGSGPYARWHAFDLGQQVSVYADATGDSVLPGGGFAQVQAAIADWGSVPSTDIKVSYGGTMSYTMTCTSGQDTPAYGTNIVMFNDPCSDIADLSSCSGTLAFGGPWYSGSHTFDGTTWSTISSWFVIVNNGTGCLGSTNYQLMLEHELGHGLGFAHVSDTSALMYFMCCHPMDATDVGCAQYLYPAAGGTTPTPTPPSTPTPTPGAGVPAKPTGVSATKGTYTDRIELTWNTVPTATSYDIFRNSASTAPASPFTSVSSVYNGLRDSTASAGVTYWYWVRAVNGSGAGPLSNSDYGYRAAAPTPTPTPTPGGLTVWFTFAPQKPVAAKPVSFTDASTRATSWLWSFGDGQTSLARNPIHTYPARGTYTVTLRVSDGTSAVQTTRVVTVGERVRRHFR